MSSSLARRPSPAGQPGARGPAMAGRAEQVRMSGLGLDLPARLPYERWLGIGRQLSAVTTSAAWCLGDWLVFGEKAYAGRYRQAVEQTGLDYQTLRNYAWVAHRFALSRRRDTLSFGHHAEVAALSDAEQDYWLRQAEEHRWPVKHLRREVRASLAERSGGQAGQPGPGGQDWILLRLEIRISADQMEACQAAAGQASLSIEAWSALALEHAARTELPAAATPAIGETAYQAPLPAAEGTNRAIGLLRLASSRCESVRRPGIAELKESGGNHVRIGNPHQRLRQLPG